MDALSTLADSNEAAIDAQAPVHVDPSTLRAVLQPLSVHEQCIVLLLFFKMSIYARSGRLGLSLGATQPNSELVGPLHADGVASPAAYHGVLVTFTMGSFAFFQALTPPRYQWTFS